MRALILAVLAVSLAAAPAAAADEPKDQPNETEKAIIDLTNKEREKEKLPPLKINPVLMRIAHARTQRTW